MNSSAGTINTFVKAVVGAAVARAIIRCARDAVVHTIFRTAVVIRNKMREAPLLENKNCWISTFDGLRKLETGVTKSGVNASQYSKGYFSRSKQQYYYLVHCSGIYKLENGYSTVL